MNPSATDSWAVRSAASTYAALLRLYPGEHRRRFAPEMLQLFRDHCRDALRHGGHWALAWRCLWLMAESLVNAAREHGSAVTDWMPMNQTTRNILRSLALGSLAFGVLLGLTLAVAIYTPRTYTATALILAWSPPDPIHTHAILEEATDLQWLAQLAHEGEAARDDAEASRLAQAWQRRLSFRPHRNTDVFEVRFRDRDPKEAARIANLIARGLCAGPQQTATRRVIDLAEPPLKPQSPNVPMLVAIGGATSMILGVSVAALTFLLRWTRLSRVSP